jgi:hypothetical protein
MTAAERADHTARDTILKLLSDEENAKVSSAEGSPSLAQGEEYLDLEHLDRGIQRADAGMTKGTIGHIVPRRAVHGETWSKILAQLAG